MAFFAIRADSADSACYCVDPLDDRCMCAKSAADSGTNPQYPTVFDDGSENPVELLCDTPSDANSIFAIKDPVCDARFNNEIPPYCARVNGEEHQITCWGTGFVTDIGTLPYYNTGGVVDMPEDPTTGRKEDYVINYNGFSGSGFTQIFTCHENNFCCSRTDVTCDNSSPAVQHSGNCADHSPQCGGPPYRCEINGVCSSSWARGELNGCQTIGTQPADREAACLGGPPPPPDSPGESRIWFSNARLVSALSTMAQAMFNPHGFNDQYNNTAFSKNAPGSDDQGSMTNSGALTTRIEKHQGKDDATIVVNITDNNSSVVTGLNAPGPLFGFGNTGDSNPYNDAPTCYIDDNIIANAGDDLIGPKITAELLYTERFDFEAKGKPAGCREDGEEFTRDKELDGCGECCSGECQIEGTKCTQIIFGEPCTTSRPNFCVDGNNQSYCCADGESCEEERVTCNELPPLKLPAQTARSLVFSKTPLVEYIYDVVVDGKDSLFNRFMPNDRTIVEKVEYPSQAYFTASAQPAGPGSVSGTGETKFADGQASNPTVYFPRLGGLYKYWLLDVQNGLRPYGFAVTGITNLPPEFTEPPPDDNGGTNTPNLSVCDGVPEPTGHNVKSLTALLDQPGGLISTIWNPNVANPDVSRENIERCYNYVISQSMARSRDPALTMAIWIEESGASNYERFSTVDDFGCVGVGATNQFERQLDCFLGLEGAYAVNDNHADCRAVRNPQNTLDTLEFMQIYACGDSACGDPGSEEWDFSCTYPDSSPGTINWALRLNEAYKAIHRSSQSIDFEKRLPSSTWN